MDETTRRDPRGLEVDIGLAIDVQGRVLVRGEPVTHRRTHDVLLENLYADEQGRVCTRIGYEWSLVAVEDTPLLVLGVDFEAAGAGQMPYLALSGGTAERLDPRTLWLEGERLYCRVRGGRLEARFVPAAAAALLLECLEGDEQHPRARFGELSVELRESKRSVR